MDNEDLIAEALGWAEDDIVPSDLKELLTELATRLQNLTRA